MAYSPLDALGLDLRIHTGNEIKSAFQAEMEEMVGRGGVGGGAGRAGRRVARRRSKYPEYR